MQTILEIFLASISVFMILLILIQRGKGGGLAGAFGGMGGQSAFGTKAGDAFTKITVVVAVIWFIFCIGTILLLKGIGTSGLRFGSGSTPPAATATDEAGTTDSSAPTSTPTGGSDAPAE